MFSRHSMFMDKTFFIAKSAGGGTNLCSILSPRPEHHGRQRVRACESTSSQISSSWLRMRSAEQVLLLRSPNKCVGVFLSCTVLAYKSSGQLRLVCCLSHPPLSGLVPEVSFISRVRGRRPSCDDT